MTTGSKKEEPMHKRWVAAVVVCCIGLLLCAFSAVRADEADDTVKQMTAELQESGTVTAQEAAAIRAPLKNMVRKGADKKELKDTVAGLTRKGAKGDDLKRSVESMSDLVNAGENPEQAGNVVSQAAAQAHAQGLKGKALAAKVHEAVRARKEEREKEKGKNKKEKDKEKEKGKKEKASEKGKSGSGSWNPWKSGNKKDK
jgi:hypothetical protein